MGSGRDESMNDDSKIEESFRSFEVAAKCDHDLEYRGNNKLGAQIRHCRKCGCRFASYPGAHLYDPSMTAFPYRWPSKRQDADG